MPNKRFDFDFDFDLYTIAGVYRLHLFSLQKFNFQFFTTLDSIRNSCVLLVDFNFNLCSNFNYTVVSDFTDSFIASGFQSLINVPTRKTDNSATCIDHTYRNFRVQCSSCVIEIKPSDHKTTFASLRITKTKLNDHEWIQFRDHSGQSFKKIRISL